VDTPRGVAVGRSYTTGRRQPYLIRKWPGSNWALPMGPYTVAQLLVFVGSIYLLFTYRGGWAHFGALNLVIGVGIPIGLTYAARHTRIEGRDPVRAAASLVGLLLQPRDGYLNGNPLRTHRIRRMSAAPFPAARPPTQLAPPPPSQPAGPPEPLPGRRWVADLVRQVAAGAGGA
jgi:hypothetical protein